MANIRYVTEILEKTLSSTDQVTIEPDGKWSQTSELDTQPGYGHNQTYSGDDDELVEIKDVPRIAAAKNKGASYASPAREQQASTPSVSSTGSKRSINQVIDLTFSSDENDEPPRTPKRQLVASSSNGFPSFPSSDNVRSKPSNGSSRDPRNLSLKPFHTAYSSRTYTEPH